MLCPSSGKDHNGLFARRLPIAFSGSCGPQSFSGSAGAGSTCRPSTACFAIVVGYSFFAVAVKLNSADFQRGGFSTDDAKNVISLLNPLGVDLIELSGGS